MEKIKVLYIDDELVNLQAFKASFRRIFDIYTARSADLGIEILKDHPIEVIIADQKMPGKTGVDFFESILNTYPNPIRILLTAYSDINAIIDAINKGQVYRYITKPWNDYELKLTIENAYQLYLLKEQNNKLNLKYTKVFKESSDPILLFDTKGRIVDYNQSTVDILQANDSTLNFTSFSSIIHNEHNTNQIMEKLLKEESISDFECEIISKKNVIRNCLVSANTIKDAHSKIICYQVVLKDITERSKMNKLLLKTIIETQEVERERIAKDLHDGVGQTLAAIKLHVDAIRFKDVKPQDEEYGKIEEMLENSIKQLRKICYDTLPTILSEYGIIKAIDELAQKSSSESFKIVFNYSPSIPNFDKSLEIALYRIVQEFVNNTMKHGEATEVVISIENNDNNLVLDLIDNGKGFNITDLMIYKGQGLKNIKSRVESFNGRVNFKSSQEKGTEFNISIPVNLN